MRSIWRRSAGTVSPWLSAFSLISSPLTRMMPLVGFSRQLMQRSSVDLPEPLPPMMATTSPSRADSDTPFSTCSWPNFLCRFSMWIASAAPSLSTCGDGSDAHSPRLQAARRRWLRRRSALTHHPVTLEPTVVQDGPRARAVRQPCRLSALAAKCRQMVIGGGSDRRGGRHEHPGRQVVRRAVDGGAAAARADALGGQRDAAAPRPREWHYGAGLRSRRAGRQHEAFADLVAASGAEIEWLPDDDDGLADSVFTHDPSLMTDHGAIILSMGKALRRARAGAARGRLPAARHPDPRPHRGAGHRSKAATASGSTATRWRSAAACAPTRPASSRWPTCWRRSASRCSASTCRCGMGEEACLHLMSVISPLADDLALVLFAAAAGGLLPAAEGARHPAGRGRRRRVRGEQRPQPQRAADRARAR